MTVTYSYDFTNMNYHPTVTVQYTYDLQPEWEEGNVGEVRGGSSAPTHLPRAVLPQRYLQSSGRSSADIYWYRALGILIFLTTKRTVSPAPPADSQNTGQHPTIAVVINPLGKIISANIVRQLSFNKKVKKGKKRARKRKGRKMGKH